MNTAIPKEVLEAFTSYSPDLPGHSAGSITVEKIGNGLINHSYKVSCELKPDFFLQRVNKNVFHYPEYLQENYIHLSQYAEFVRKDSFGEFTNLRMPWPVYCGKESTLFIDSNEDYWRAFEFIEESKTVIVAEKTSQAKTTARAFAKFTAAFADMNVDLLKEVIPGFHNLSLRYKQFEESLNTELYERMAKTIDLVKELKQRERYKHFYEIITGSGEFPKRVMHHDAKISNVLFHQKSGEVICPVDYDTAMPGYFFSDLGDMIRSMACSHDENQSTGILQIRKDFYESIISGYTEVMDNQLSSLERKYIHSSGLLMIYMQALRFITDYLNGDTYYKVTYLEQNFDRAINQLTLLQKLEEFLLSNYNFKI
jgi:thiamine kinase-like enzyme